MQTTPTPGLLNQLSDLLRPAAAPEPQPQVANERTPAPRKMVTAQRPVHQGVDQRKSAAQHRAQAREGSGSEPPRDTPRGTLLNIVV